MFSFGLCLNNGDGDRGSVSQKIIGSLWGAPSANFTVKMDSTVSDGILPINLPIVCFPASVFKFWINEPAPGISFAVCWRHNLNPTTYLVLKRLHYNLRYQRNLK